MSWWRVNRSRRRVTYFTIAWAEAGLTSADQAALLRIGWIVSTVSQSAAAGSACRNARSVRSFIVSAAAERDRVRWLSRRCSVPRFEDSRAVLAVQDLATSTRFYTDVLGFRRDPVDAKGWSFLSKDAFKLMLGECADEISAAEIGNHAWFARVMVAGLDEYFTEVSARGVDVLSKPTDRAYGLREFVIRTPDGHRLMFAERLDASREHR
jgi:catechol 2,3-dioxygenase-like lactoylglutathione lyase family enzyme